VWDLEGNLLQEMRNETCRRKLSGRHPQPLSLIHFPQMESWASRVALP
jgi:hypothetical protein